MPDIGIVMPVYNQDPFYLRTALHSVLNQTYRNYHFVIVVDGASEETREIVEQETMRDSRVERIVKPVNEGVAKALNTGFEKLRSRSDILYYTWVSSDNIYYPAFLKTLRNAIVRAPEKVGIVYSSFRHVNASGQPRKDIDLAQFRKYQNQPKDKILEFCFIGASFMYKRMYADSLSGYWAEPVEDYEYWLRLTEKCDVRFVPVELMDYREESPHSISAKLNSSEKQHRQWRYANQKVKLQARKRRGLAPETTVFYLVQNQDSSMAESFEKVLDQLYDDYRLILVDVSRENLSKTVVNEVQDPRTELLHCPGASIRSAIEIALSKTTTPFSVIYTVNQVPASRDVLSQQAATIRNHKNNPSTIAVTHLGNLVKARNVPAPEEPVFEDLYRTPWLKSHFFNNKSEE